MLNHKAGADRAETFKVVKVDEEDRTKVISEPVRAPSVCFSPAQPCYRFSLMLTCDLSLLR